MFFFGDLKFYRIFILNVLVCFVLKYIYFFVIIMIIKKLSIFVFFRKGFMFIGSKNFNLVLYIICEYIYRFLGLNLGFRLC